MRLDKDARPGRRAPTYHPPVRGAWLILLAAVLWGTTGTAQELGPDSANPLAVGALRLVVGATALIALAILGATATDWRWPIGSLTQPIRLRRA